MALIEKLKNIANAIRSKTNKTEELTLEQMASEVEGIYSPKAEEVREVTIENNGLNTITPNEGYDVMKKIEVTTRVVSGDGYDIQSLGYTKDESDIFNKYYQDAILNSKNILIEENAPTTNWQQKFQNSDIVFLPNIDVSQVTNMFNAFYNSKLEYVPKDLYFASVINFTSAFNYCYFLKEFNCVIDSPNCTTMQNCFKDCRMLMSITDNINVPNNTNLNSTFLNCENLQSSINITTDNVETFQNAFHTCIKVTKIQLTNIDKGTTFVNTFYNCSNLINLSFKKWKKLDISLAQSSKLSPESIHYIIQNAMNVVDGATEGRKLTLHATAKTNWMNSEYYEEDEITRITKGIEIA